MKDFEYLNIHNVNTFHFVIVEVNGYIEEINKYLIFASTDKNKEVLTKFTELWDWTKNMIEKSNDKPGEYGKEFMKIKINSDDSLPLNKILKLHNLAIAIQSVFQENNKYYPQLFLDECLYEL